MISIIFSQSELSIQKSHKSKNLKKKRIQAIKISIERSEISTYIEYSHIGKKNLKLFLKNKKTKETIYSIAERVVPKTLLYCYYSFSVYND